MRGRWAVLALLVASPALAGDRPAWCQAGYVCLPTATAADQEAAILERDARIVVLEADVAALKKRSGTWRWFLGPTVSLSVEQVRTEPDGTYGLEYHFGPGVSAGFGLTW